MPYQVSYEFLTKRCEVIYETDSNYEKLIEEKNKFKNRISTLLRLKETDQDLKVMDKCIIDWIEKQKRQNLIVHNHGDDTILEKIISLYDKRTGEPNSKDIIMEIKKEGKERYENLIPPGYKDKKKGDDVCDNNMYGDLIIWKQILEYSKSNLKGIIYVTDDQKEDWWNIVKGKTIGPRFELRKEFSEITKQKFHMYTMDSFIKVYEKQSGNKIDTSVIDEVIQYSTNVEIYNAKRIAFNKKKYYNLLNHNIDNLSEVDRQNFIDGINSKLNDYQKVNNVVKEKNHNQIYIKCPRCRYSGFSESENECPKCGYAWID